MLEDIFNFNYFLLIRIAVAALFGGIIGLERSENNHAAGLRTHIVLCLGAASIMVVSECIVGKYGVPTEIMRMGAQIISGVGFLGAGSIIIDGRNNKIQGITTAAGLWTTACLGIVIGCGYYVLGTVVLAVMMLAMLGLRPLASHLNKKNRYYRLSLTCKNTRLSDILQTLSNKNIHIKSFSVNTSDDEYDECTIDVSVPKKKLGEAYIVEALAGFKVQMEISRLN